MSATKTTTLLVIGGGPGGGVGAGGGGAAAGPHDPGGGERQRAEAFGEPGRGVVGDEGDAESGFCHESGV